MTRSVHSGTTGVVGSAVGARKVADALPARIVAGPVGEALRECGELVVFAPTGEVVRALGGRADAPVVVVEESGRFAIALSGVADGLAARVAGVLGCRAVPAGGTGLPGLDVFAAAEGAPWPVTGAVAAVREAMLAGADVILAADARYPLPALPPHVRVDAPVGSPVLRVTDRIEPVDAETALLHPPTLVIGVGASRGVSAEEVGGLIDRALAEAALAPESVRHVATADIKSDEAGIVAAVAERGWRLVCHPVADLAAVDVPNPSEVVRAEIGSASVAEAAALLGGADLVVDKHKSAMATVAVARRPARGRLAVVGLGPGARDLLTPRAEAELRRAAVLVGLDQYLDQVADLFSPYARVLASGLGAEEQRARQAVDEARRGQAVALVGSGDAGVYAMASPALEFAGDDIDVVSVPGVTAALAAAALLGAPLGHDHVAISLSDLHTDWSVIEARVRAAAETDLVVTFYNPRSRGRGWQLPEALGILAARRKPDTPVGVVRNASRADESVRLTTLGEIDVDTVDMLSVVVVGSSHTVRRAGRMVTSRGYRWQG